MVEIDISAWLEEGSFKKFNVEIPSIPIEMMADNHLSAHTLILWTYFKNMIY